jgi:hypothetical protein
MSTGQPLTLEVLSGPLDGAAITLEAKADWSRAGKGRLSFPWDAELGAPQARFTLKDDGWHIEGLNVQHGTYRINCEERLTGKSVSLEDGDILKASQTWLLVRQA